MTVSWLGICRDSRYISTKEGINFLKYREEPIGRGVHLRVSNPTNTHYNLSFQDDISFIVLFIFALLLLTHSGMRDNLCRPSAFQQT